MSFIGEVLLHVLGEAVGGVADRPAASLGASLRKRVTVGLVVVSWICALLAMFAAWHIGTRHSEPGALSIATLLWFACPTLAILLTVLWFDRRDT